MNAQKLLSIGLNCVVALAVCLAWCGCGQGKTNRPAKAASPPAGTSIEPLALALAPHEGDTPVDAEIRQRQAQVHTGHTGDAALERLGWLFVAKARESFDPGFYKLAEQCALSLEARTPGSTEALLLRGHSLQSQHRFKEAEVLAHELVQRRGLAFDHGLLGDILVDLGQVDEAASAYQAMIDLKPDPQGYVRGAHIRWLKGDVAGAIELMRLAVRGVSHRDAESAAWMHTQLARYLWQSRLNDEAARALDIALELQSKYPVALLLRGRMLLSDGKSAEAVPVLRDAAKANPLPEYLWVLSEALRAARNEPEAREVEMKLTRSGSCSDPRTCSLYLSGRRENPETALSLAQEEFTQREDIFTHDALAWALAAVGRYEDANQHLFSALKHGTRDARLFLHATVIAAHSGRLDEAGAFLAQLKPLMPLLLPSERRQLEDVTSVLSQRGSTVNASPEKLSRL